LEDVSINLIITYRYDFLLAMLVGAILGLLRGYRVKFANGKPLAERLFYYGTTSTLLSFLLAVAIRYSETINGLDIINNVHPIIRVGVVLLVIPFAGDILDWLLSFAESFKEHGPLYTLKNIKDVANKE